MALNALTLSVTTGVQGRRFKSAINGLTAGSTVEAVGPDGAPGFWIANGFLHHEALPYEVSTAVLRERNPVTGENKTTYIVITAATQYAVQQQVAALGSVNGRVVPIAQADGSLAWTAVAETAVGATAKAPVIPGSGGGGGPVNPARALTFNDNTPLQFSDGSYLELAA